MTRFDEVHANTRAVYERNAEAWDKRRCRDLTEKKWLDRFIQGKPAGASVLDAGCGAGEPIARYLTEKGLTVVGLDQSPAMIEMCKRRMPGQTWLVMDMCELSLNQQFDGIVAWDSFFHLNPDEQRSTIRRFSRHLNPGGTLLTTVGHFAGEVLGKVEGEPVYHSSFSPDQYKKILQSEGFDDIQLAIKDAFCDRTVLFATFGNHKTRSG